MPLSDVTGCQYSRFLYFCTNTHQPSMCVDLDLLILVVLSLVCFLSGLDPVSPAMPYPWSSKFGLVSLLVLDPVSPAALCPWWWTRSGPCGASLPVCTTTSRPAPWRSGSTRWRTSSPSTSCSSPGCPLGWSFCWATSCSGNTDLKEPGGLVLLRNH